MAATIRTAAGEATIDGYRWKSESRLLARLLNAMLPEGGPSGSDPNPDLTAARDALGRIGGELVRYDKAESVEGRIY